MNRALELTCIFTVGIGIIILIWGTAETDPMLITTPVPAWHGSGMNEAEFLAALEDKRRNYYVTGAAIIATGLLFYPVLKIKNIRRKRTSRSRTTR